jgi:LuxR family maltose regulon positive regulatory protein
MEHPILLVKFYVPQLKANLVTRPRLLTLLNEGLEKKLTILSAPAGFGKSTLLSDWLRNVKYPYAWVSLDKDDNDVVRFMKYFVNALQQLDPNIDNTVLDLLYSPQPMFHSAALTALINQIDNIKTNAILVLDDYHLISNQEIHQSIEYLLNYLPENFHLVISSRADPPFAYSLLRAQGELVEIRMNHLKFSGEEAKIFIRKEIDLQISDQVISELTKRTEGWISGLQMASLSIRHKENAEAFVQSFSGSHKFILDYLFEEVLSQQPENIRRFLLFTSILERMNGPLCDKILGRKDSQAVLERLEKENLFLIPLDNEREWYRYHQLFKDLLNHHLTLEYAEKIPQLYQLASQWHEQAEWIALAIDYSLKAEDFENALDLILIEAENTLMRSEVNTYQGWVSKLPDELLEGNPKIEFLNVWAQILKGVDFEDSLSQFVSPDQTSNLSGRKLALQAFIHISKGNFAQAGGMAEKALEKLDRGDDYFRGISIWIRGVYHALQHDVEGVLVMLEDLSTFNGLQRYPMLHVLLLSQIAHAHARLGNFAQAEQIYEQALESAKDRQGNWIPIAGEALMGYGDLLRELNKLDQATDMILDGIELTQQWRKAAAIEGYLFLARVKQLQNNFASANAALEKAMKLAVEYDAIDFDDRMVAMWQARLWCFEGKTHLVESWVQKVQLQDEVEPIVVDGTFNIENYLHSRENMVLARYYLLTKQYEQALFLADQLLIFFDEYGRLDLQIELYLLQAIIFQRIQQKEKALFALGKAIQLGKGRFLGIFLECRSELKELIRLYSRSVTVPLYAQQLLDAFIEKTVDVKEKIQPLIEPLSDRELDVLKYLPSNLTTPEIADEMMISINTVRTHIKNIYQKLGVHKRSEAVNISQDLKLIRPS